MLPYGRQSINSDDIEAVIEVLRSEWLTTGPAVDLFEAAFAIETQSKFAIAVNSGTAALHAALNAVGIQPGDEVIVPAITFVATANAVLYQGATPVFADVEPSTMLIDADDVARKLSRKTKAIIAVDYAGTPCDYDRLSTIAHRHRLVLIADACHSLGGSFRDRPVGSLAEINCFSFHPVKPITTGEGGMITTNNAFWNERIRRFRNHGISQDFRQRIERGSFDYCMTDLGYNFRMTDLQAALGLSQLGRLTEFIERRRALASLYAASLGECNSVRLLEPLSDRNSAWHLFVAIWNEECTGISRDKAFRFFRANQIGVNVHYKPVYLHPYYQSRFGDQSGSCPVAEEAYATCLTLPLFPSMSNEDVEQVARICQRLGRVRISA